ncbi:hypothetical protein AALP_AA4G046900 [Arabis alpina]|uniref:Uncharacterized protein n=1 Tax=Arabis alpina TaxID=50452 RepID=A0A087H163_ARAAL|nr:hypothetical protein AALP_AA4G046900 [Arabis alpina]
MDHFRIFLLTIAICFGLNKACKINHIVFHNELAPNVDLNIQCRFGDPSVKPYIIHTLKYKAPFITIPFKDRRGTKVTKCYCVLSWGENPTKLFDIRVYHSKTIRQCGALRSWIARKDGIYYTQDYWKPPGWVLKWQEV